MMTKTDSLALSKQTEEWIGWLASYGQTEENGVTRLLYDETWQAAQAALQEKMAENGLAPYFDDVGNLYGRLQGSDKKAPVVLTGSHIDTVANGGKYDGAYGIIASTLAVSRLYEQHGQPVKTIEVVSLCEEEGSRFPLTYWGSGSITGLRTPADIEGLADRSGISMTKAMNAAGFGLGRFAAAKRDDISCFIELHVEQGQVLEREKKAVGVVSHIVGQRRYNVTVGGESNHAGTTPMPYRKDAVGAAAALVCYLLEAAKQTDANLVATVGRMDVKPNVPNVIASEVTFSVDIRHSNEALLEQFSSTVFTQFEKICRSHGTSLAVQNWMNEKPVAMCPELSAKSAELLKKTGIPYLTMTSGAGHDSQVFGRYVPTSLVFVPSRAGISHSPLEFTEAADLEKGVQLLMNILYEAAYKGGNN